MYKRQFESDISAHGPRHRKPINLFPRSFNNKTSAVDSNIATSELINRTDKYRKQYKEDISILAIDSTDRDLNKWPLSSEFEVLFAPTSGGVNDFEYIITDAYINQDFRNVKTIELTSAIIPANPAPGGDDITEYPYLLLSIPEIGGNLIGTNTVLSNAFAKLEFADQIGDFLHLPSDRYGRNIKNFNPHLTKFHKFTIRILKPDGTPFNFIGNLDPDDPITQVSLSFEITELDAILVPRGRR